MPDEPQSGDLVRGPEPREETPCPLPTPPRPEIRPASEPTCCGSGCDDCPF